MVSQEKNILKEVAPGIWALNMSVVSPNGGGPNAGFIIAGDKTIVVDALISLKAARELLGAIKKAGGKSPSFLVLTHSHGDHIIGSQVFSTTATVIAQENCREEIIKNAEAGLKRTKETRSFLFSAEDLEEARVVVPEVTFCDAMSFSFGNRDIELFYPGPAHSTGDTLVYVPDAQVLFAGDLLFNHIIPPIMGDSLNWVRTLQWLEELDIKVIIPGHGVMATKDDLIELRKYLQRLRREVKKCYDRKVPQDKVIPELDLGKYREWPNQDRLVPSVALIYKELKGGE
jgi:cyclase